MTGLSSSTLVAFAATTDLVRAARFYVQALGLRLVDQNDYAAVFDANGTMLRVTAVESMTPAPYTVLGWSVVDIEGTVDELVANDVVFLFYDGMEQDDRGIWTTPGGDQVAWFVDADGNTLSLTQFT